MYYYLCFIYWILFICIIYWHVSLFMQLTPSSILATKQMNCGKWTSFHFKLFLSHEMNHFCQNVLTCLPTKTMSAFSSCATLPESFENHWEKVWKGVSNYFLFPLDYFSQPLEIGPTGIPRFPQFGLKRQG